MNRPQNLDYAKKGDMVVILRGLMLNYRTTVTVTRRTVRTIWVATLGYDSERRFGRDNAGHYSEYDAYVADSKPRLAVATPDDEAQWRADLAEIEETRMRYEREHADGLKRLNAALKRANDRGGAAACRVWPAKLADMLDEAFPVEAKP
jgi:hypothetical protein